MKLTQEEQAVLDSIIENKKILDVVEKFFIRPFEGLPEDFAAVPNEELGAQMKAHLKARQLNRFYLSEMKRGGTKGGVSSPVAPD